jgi:hypothetical protein
LFVFRFVFLYDVRMKKMFDKPKAGTVVTVVTDWSDYYKTFDAQTKRQRTYTGTVVRSESYDDAFSFRLSTGDKSFPIRVIDLEHVINLFDSSGKQAKSSEKKESLKSVWEVKSDSRKGGFYTVTREGSHFSCTCVGFGFRKTCRHINSVKLKSAA